MEVLNHPITYEHSRRFIMGTNNTIFAYALTAKHIDQSHGYSQEVRSAMNWPEWIKNDYDLKKYFGVYERLFQFTIISLCSDIEYFFKDLFFRENLIPRNGRGYFQRFSDVTSDLKRYGAPLDTCQDALEKIKLAFSIRHVAIHNFGMADESFIKSTNSMLRVGDHVQVNQEIYRQCSDAYRELLRHMDQWLTIRSKDNSLQS